MSHDNVPATIMTRRLRSILFAGALCVCVCSAALGKGEYQQTRDGKTTVWNATPKSGETLAWDGSRDHDGYATGFGDLTWYNAAGKVYALYYGNMVHGKFEGAVNFHSGNRRAHAYFVDGDRVTAWARGPAPANMKVPEDIVAQRRKAEAEPPPPPKSSRAEAIAKSSPAAKEPEKPKAEEEKEATTEHAVSETSATPAESMPAAILERTPELVTSASPTHAFDERTPFPTSTPESTKIEPPRIPTPEASATTKTKIEEASPEQRSTPSEEHSPPQLSESPTPASETSRTRSDISVNALTGPPTSLRSTSESPSAKSEAAATERASGPLTESDAINLADTEARIHGYQLDNYERPRVDHSKVKGKWTLFYAPKSPGGGAENSSPLTVTVQDRTKKVEFKE